MHPLRRVVDPLLQRPLKMRERLGRAAEAHTLADVVPALLAERAVLTGQTDFERDAVADPQMAHLRANTGHDAGRLVAQRHGLAHEDVAVAVVREVVQVGAAEAGRLHGDLDFGGGRGRELSGFLGGVGGCEFSRVREGREEHLQPGGP